MQHKMRALHILLSLHELQKVPSQSLTKKCQTADKNR